MGKAKIFSDESREAVYQSEFDNEVYNIAGQQNSYNLGSTHFSDQSGIGNFQQSGRDQRNASLKGALFRGNIGFDQQTVELDVGTFTINLNNDSSAVALGIISTDRFVTLSSGTTGDLVTITGAQRPGQRLRLYNTLTNTITIKHTAAATVNTIRTPDATDLIFPGNAAIDLTFDITTAQWRVVGNVGGSGSSGYTTIQEEGVSLTQRAIMNFIGASVTAVDNPGQSRTDITITGGGGTSPPFPDTQVIIEGSADATKLLRFEVDGFTTATTRVLTPQDADATIAGLELTQTWSGINTFTGTVFNAQTDDINLGDAIADSINFLGRSGTDLVPIANSTHNLGTSGFQWNTLWIDTLSNATTVVVNSPNFAMNSSQITLGDNVTDDIFFLGQVANNIVMEEITTPAAADANTGRFYAKDDGGITNPFWIDESGTETGILGANRFLSNLTAPTAVNTTLQPGLDGLTNLGSFSFNWDEIFGRTLIFKEDKPVDATETAIGADGTELWLNQTNAGNLIAFRWDDVPSYEFGRTIFKTQNPVLSWQLVNGATNTFSITDFGTHMEFLNSNYDIFRFEGANHTRLDLTGIGFTVAGLNEDEILFDSSNSTASDIVGQVHFVGHTDTVANFDIAKIVAINQVPTNVSRSGLLEFRVSQSGTENTLMMDIDGFNDLVNMRAELDMNNNKIADIGETTITDLTTVTAASGDLVMAVDATDGLMKNIDVVDFLSAGALSTLTIDVTKDWAAFGITNLGQLDLVGDIVMANNDITGLNAIGFTDAGGQIAGSAVAPHMNFVLTGASTFRFTTNAENILDITSAGLTILGTNNIILGNNNITGLNSLEFNEAGQTIADSVSGIVYTVGSGDTHNFVVNGATQILVDDGFVDLLNQFVDMDNLATPANPAAGTRRLFVDSGSGQISVRTSAGTTVSLEGAGSVFPVTDTVFQVTDDIDVTKTWQVSLAGMTANDAALFNFSTTASRTYTFPDISGNIIMDAGTQSISGLKDFDSGTLLISNPLDSFEYAINGSAILADRTLTLPLLTGNDTFVTEAHSQTLSNKTLTLPVISNFTNAVHDHSNASGGGQLTNSALISGVFSSITGVGTQSQNLVMGNNNITGLNAIAFTDSGGQIAGSPSLMNFVLTGSSTFRFTTNAEDILDITSAGLTILGTNNIILGNNNITGVNSLQFNSSGQTITDGVSAMTIAVGSGDTIDLSVNSGVQMRVDDGFVDLFNQFVDMDNLATPANPAAGTRRLFVDSGTGEMSVRTNAGTTVSLEGAGGTSNIIQQLDSFISVVDAGTGTLNFEIDGSPVAAWTTSLGLEMLTDMDMNLNEIHFNNAESFIDLDATDNGMAIHNQTTDQFNLKWGSALEYDFNETEFDLHGNNIINNSGTDIIWRIGTAPNQTRIHADGFNLKLSTGSASDEIVFELLTTDMVEINANETRFLNTDIEMDLNQDIRWSASIGGAPRIGVVSSAMTFEVGSTADILFDFGPTPDVQMKFIPDGQTGSGNAFIVIAKQTNSLLSVFEAQQDRASGGSAGKFAALQFTAKNSLNDLFLYGAMECFVDSNVNNSEDAEIGIPIAAGGGFVDSFTTDGDGSTTIPRIGFRGASPQIAQNYTLNTFSIDRNLSSSPSTTELRDVLGTLITDLIAMGLIQ